MNLTKPDNRRIAVLPRGMARCTPLRACPQAEHCARFHAAGRARVEFNGTVCACRRGCELFLDARGARLLQKARAA